MIYLENNIVYRTLHFLGYPDYRVGIDGSIWSLNIIYNIKNRKTWTHI